MIDKDLLDSLRLVHGGYNLVVVLLFLYQGWLGLAIRRARIIHAPLPFAAIRAHRRSGPVFAALAFAGYLFGIVLVLVDTRNLFEYPVHFAAGSLIMIMLSAAFILSRKIKGQDPVFRTRHAVAGAVALALFVVNLLLGLSVLL